jgi:hypothetical protein
MNKTLQQPLLKSSRSPMVRSSTTLTKVTQRSLVSPTPNNSFMLRGSFHCDNGGALNLYSVRQAEVKGTSDLCDDFIDLGNLKGNIGAQNYALDPDVDADLS